MKPVLVAWTDSKGSSNLWEHYCDIESFRQPLPWSIGFIREETDTYIEIVQTIDTDQIMGRIQIPKACILDIYPISVPVKFTLIDNHDLKVDKDEPRPSD